MVRPDRSSCSLPSPAEQHSPEHGLFDLYCHLVVKLQHYNSTFCCFEVLVLNYPFHSALPHHISEELYQMYFYSTLHLTANVSIYRTDEDYTQITYERFIHWGALLLIEMPHSVAGRTCWGTQDKTLLGPGFMCINICRMYHVSTNVNPQSQTKTW